MPKLRYSSPAEELADLKRGILPDYRKTLQYRSVRWDASALRILRLKLGLTLKDVWRRTLIHHSMLCCIEGGADVRLTTALKLAKFYGKPIEELWIPLDEKPA